MPPWTTGFPCLCPLLHLRPYIRLKIQPNNSHLSMFHRTINTISYLKFSELKTTVALYLQKKHLHLSTFVDLFSCVLLLNCHFTPKPSGRHGWLITVTKLFNITKYLICSTFQILLKFLTMINFDWLTTFEQKTFYSFCIFERNKTENADFFMTNNLWTKINFKAGLSFQDF